jgi:MFS family permease
MLELRKSSYQMASTKEELRVEGDGKKGQGSMSLDDAIDAIPVGTFHYRLLFMCGAVFMADAMEVNLLAFISECAGSEWGLDKPQIASITSAVFAGELFGGLFWGPVADKYGRRKSFMMAVAIISMAGVFSGASPNYATLICLRAICGFGIGGLTIPFDLLAEFMPADRRGEFLMKMEYFWTFGSIFVTGVAWIMLTRDGWRVVTYLTAIPVIVASMFSVSLLPESPRWLMEMGRTAEAEKVLKEAAEVNGTPFPPDFKLAPLQHHLKRSSDTVSGAVAGDMGGTHVGSSSKLDDDDNDDDEPVSAWRMYGELVKPKNVGYSYQLWILWFCFGLTYYGLILFVSRLYSKTDDGDDDDVTCDFDYQNVFINACSELVGIFLTLWVIDPWGRPKTLVVTFLLSALGALLLGATKGGLMMAVGLMARAAIVSANSTTWVATPELYKTKFRATGHASCNAATRLGGFLAPFIVESDLSSMSVGGVLFTFNIIAACTAFLVPDMVGLDIDGDLDFNSGALQARYLFNGYFRHMFDTAWYTIFGHPEPSSIKHRRRTSSGSGRAGLLSDPAGPPGGDSSNPLHNPLTG